MRRLYRLASCFVLALGLSSTVIHAQSQPANQIQAVNVAQQGASILLKLELKSALAEIPSSFSMANPNRIALDFPETGNGLGRAGQVVNEGPLRSINVVQVANRTRVILNLSENQSHALRLDGKSVFVTLSPVAKVADAAPQFAPPPVRVEPTPTARTEPLPAPKVEPATPSRPESQVAKTFTPGIQDITFRRGKDGEARIIVDLDKKGTDVDVKQQGKELLVDFSNTTAPERLKKKLDVTDFATPVTSIITAARGNGVRLTIQPKGLWEHNAYQTDNQLIVEVRPIVENPNKLVQGSRLGYQGPRVSINYQNGDVRGLLRLMAEELGLNAVISETVTGTTTLVLKDVPADQVVDIIFQQRGLDMRKNGNVVLIAPRDELAAREKLDNESKLLQGELEPLRTESFQINYQKADAIQKLLADPAQRMLSKRGSAVVDSRTNILFVQDTGARLEDIRKVITKVDVPVRQVLIEARIVEATDAFAKNLGARLGYSNPYAHTGSDSHRLAIGADYQTTGQRTAVLGMDPISNSLTRYQIVQGTPAFPLMQQVNLPATPRSGTAGALSFILYNSGFSRLLSLEVSALEADGKGKVISSPRVMTADQVEAIIEQGVEIPYQQATSSGATAVSFRKANLALKVKPQITPDGKITMSLEVSKDTPNPTLQTGSGVAIDTKRIKTEVLVDNGGTVVIGGIYTQTTKDQTQKIPLLGDIPLLGWAFRNNERIDDKTELLVFITPRVVTDKVDLR